MDCTMPGFPVLHHLLEFVIESVMLYNHLILCHPLLLLPSIFPRIRVFFSESAFCIRWPKYLSFSISISPSSEYSGSISFRMTGLISLLSQGLSRVFFNTTIQNHQFLGCSVFFWRRQWHPTSVLSPGKSHGWRSLVGCSPWGRE